MTDWTIRPSDVVMLLFMATSGTAGVSFAMKHWRIGAALFLSSAGVIGIAYAHDYLGWWR